MKEAISNRNEDVKEKVMFPEIVVRKIKDKPYYEIKYYDVTDKQWHLGYGSYNLDYVKQWKEECLEIVEGSVTNILVNKIKERLEEIKQAPKVKSEYNFGWKAACDAMGYAIDQVAEEYVTDTNVGNKDGWIPCSERLPTDGEIHECTAQFSTGMLYIEYSYYDIAREEWWAHDDTGLVNVIAWREHPAPYQPKGE